jgi:hypothetical protein
LDYSQNLMCARFVLGGCHPAYAVPKRGCGILVKDVQSLVEPSFLPVSQ